MRVLIDYDAGVGLLPKCTDLDTGQPALDFRVSFTVGEDPRVTPPDLDEVWTQRNGEQWLIFQSATAKAAQEARERALLESLGPPWTFETRLLMVRCSHGRGEEGRNAGEES